MKKLIVFVLLLSCLAFAQQSSNLIFGRVADKILSFEHTTAEVLADSISCSGDYVKDFTIQVNVVSVVGDSGDLATIRYFISPSNRLVTKLVSASEKDTTTIVGLRICYTDSLIAGTGLLIRYQHAIEVQTDKEGGLFSADLDSMKIDSVTSVSATPDTVVLTGAFDKGLTVIANANMAFRSNRMLGWVSLISGSSVVIPIRHEAGDTVFVKQYGSAPDVLIFRTK